MESCGVIGGPQVRNVATLAGNVAHALPAGDGSIGLLALDGEVEVVDNTGSRWMPLQQVFLGPGKSSIDPPQSDFDTAAFPTHRFGRGFGLHTCHAATGCSSPNDLNGHTIAVG